MAVAKANNEKIVRQLLECGDELRSQIRNTRALLDEKERELDSLEDTGFELVLKKYRKQAGTISGATDADHLHRKIDKFDNLLHQLDEFSRSDEQLLPDAVKQYVRYLVTKNARILILDSSAVRFLSNVSIRELNEFLLSKKANNYDTILFVCEERKHFSLIMYVKCSATAYHYDLKDKRNHELAEKLMFRLSEFFNVARTMHIDCVCNTENIESSVFLLENMMKIVHNDGAVASTDAADTFAMELINVPPQVDRLKSIVAKKYILTRIAQLGQMYDDARTGQPP